MRRCSASATPVAMMSSTPGTVNQRVAPDDAVERLRAGAQIAGAVGVHTSRTRR